MRVIEVTQFGAPDVLVLKEKSDPIPGDGQVVVDVEVADTLFVETTIRRGHGRPYFPIEPPYVPGGGVAGRVGAVGPGVDPSWVGRRVITRTTDQYGGYASQALAMADALVPVGAELSLTDAAALIHDGLTAMIVFDGVEVKPGERVLITAAAGGMGTLLVQLVHAAGAQVIAAARGQRKIELVSTLGADQAVDYSVDGWTDRVGAVDIVLDGTGGALGVAAFELVKPGGRISAHGTPAGGFAPINPEQATERNISVRGITDIHAALANASELTERAVNEAAAGRLTPVIGRTFPLAEAAQAHAAIEARETIGKSLLLV
jgi:NADPH:quinone reductase